LFFPSAEHDQVQEFGDTKYAQSSDTKQSSAIILRRLDGRLLDGGSSTTAEAGLGDVSSMELGWDAEEEVGAELGVGVGAAVAGSGWRCA